MIARSYIHSNLKNLERMYRNARSNKEALFCSKLAILELCGWIEESMDDIILRCCRRHIKLRTNRHFVEESVIRLTFGFDYEKHFRKMLIHLLGLINVERLERRVDKRIQDGLRASLSSLKSMRDREAHTHIKGVTRQIDAPSVVLRQFDLIYKGLREYEGVIRKIDW